MKNTGHIVLKSLWVLHIHYIKIFPVFLQYIKNIVI